MSPEIHAAIEPFLRRGLFGSEEEAVRELLKQYVLRQIGGLERDVRRFERRYGLSFERFADYLRERSVLLETGDLTPQQRRTLGQAIMREEDDWLAWKAAKELLESWLDLRREATA